LTSVDVYGGVLSKLGDWLTLTDHRVGAEMESGSDGLQQVFSAEIWSYTCRVCSLQLSYVEGEQLLTHFQNMQWMLIQN